MGESGRDSAGRPDPGLSSHMEPSIPTTVFFLLFSPIGAEPVQLFRKSKCRFPRQESDRTGRGDGHRGDLGSAAGCVSFAVGRAWGDGVMEKLSLPGFLGPVQ